MNICLEIMREDNSVWTLGDVIRVFEPHPNLLANPQCNMPKKAYIFISDVPDTVFRKLKYMFEDMPDDDEELKQRPRANAIDTAVLPNQVRRALTQAPFIYQTDWNTVRNFAIKRKKLNTDVTLDILKEDTRYDL